MDYNSAKMREDPPENKPLEPIAPPPVKRKNKMTDERFTMMLFAFGAFVGSWFIVPENRQLVLGAIGFFFFGISMLMKFFENHFK